MVHPEGPQKPEQLPVIPGASPFLGHDAELSRETFGASTGLDVPFSGFIVLSPEQKILITGARLAALDLDETLVAGTGEAVHDGAGARFAFALRNALEQRGKVFSEEEWGLLWSGKGSDKGFRKFTGRAEQQVLDDLAEAANAKFPPAGEARPIGASELKDLSSVFLLHSDYYSGGIREIEGVPGLVGGLREAGVKLGLCTASSAEFVLALEQLRNRSGGKDFSFLGACDYLVTNAKKKVGDHEYRGEPYAMLCEVAHVPKHQCVMLGDSISDIATAALNDCPLVIIHFPGDGGQQLTQRKKLQELLRASHEHHPNLGENTTIVIVGHYDQVAVAPLDLAAVRVGWQIGSLLELGL